MGGGGKVISKQNRQGDRLMRMVAIALVLSLAGVVHADQNSAFQDANAFAGSKTDGMFTGVASGSVSDKIPGYGTNPAETQFFQGGQGQLSGPGVAKMQNCGVFPADPDPIKRQECEAVNFLARNPDVRPQFNITNNDPMVLGAKDARNNAESFFQSAGIAGGTGASSQCTTRTETTPAQYTTETCTSLREVGTQQCTMGRAINIDADSNFQCDQAVNVYESLSCDEGNINCNITGQTLKCAATSARCISGGGACCMINISCAGNATIVQHNDCCGYSYSATINNIQQFISPGVVYNPAGARITCSSSGSCTMSFENYYCSSPSVSIGHYPNANSFNMNASPVFSCTTGGGCEALDARTR